ncbi:MAG: CocE/NonD family hydrolase [Lysobacterales bacterium]|jgi:putative CocE/NonD family hydrolase
MQVRTFGLGKIVAVWLLSTCGASAQNSALDELAKQFTVESNVPVAMRDGVLLRADVIRPRASGRYPTLLYRTPYGKRRAVDEYTTFREAVERGYAVVLQDVRGRYASAGEFVPYQHEGHDGYDTIEWAARQPWSDGNVGTFGLSYPGAVQWLAAVESPPHLKAMAPFMTFSTPRNFFYSGEVFDGSWLEWIWDSIAPDLRVKKGLADPQAAREADADGRTDLDRMHAFLPMLDLPDLKQVAPFYYEWLKHPAWDSWWDWAELRGKYSRVQAAVLNLSGWYDETYGPDGATTNFNGLLAARRKWADPATRTIIGPWVHGVESTQRTNAGDRHFFSNAAIDYDEIVLRWMDHYLRGTDNGVEREKRVRFYVMGDNVWREEDAWPPRARRTEYFLSGGFQHRHGLLTMSNPGNGDDSSSFVSDPAHPVSDSYASLGGHDYRSLEQRDDVLFFDTEPLRDDTEVTGPVTAKIFVSVDAPDADLWVRLLDVAPDGTAWNLMSPGPDVQRLSYRHHTAKRELLTPGKIYEITLDRLLTSNVFKKGHRIRVQISGAFFPRFSRNLQTGKLETTSAETRKAKITIHHDVKHRSRIVLPEVVRQP